MSLLSIADLFIGMGIMIRNDKRRQIMRVVEKLAADRRFHEITLDEVAEAAGVGKGTIYHYFKDKDDLFFQVATSGFDELCELLQQTVPDNASFAVKLSDMCSQISRFLAIKPSVSWMTMMQSQAVGKQLFRKQWMLKRKKLVNIVSRLLSDGVSDGIVRTDISTEVLANCLLGILRTCARNLDNSSEFIQKNGLLTDLFLKGACQANSMLSVHCLEAPEDGNK